MLIFQSGSFITKLTNTKDVKKNAHNTNNNNNILI